MLTSILDSYFDSILIKRIKYYEQIVRKLDIPSKKTLIENSEDVSFKGFNEQLDKLLYMRNKIAHGQPYKVTVNKNICEDNLKLVLKLLYIVSSKKYLNHPRADLLS